MKKLKVLDLFSGIGGFSLGLERTGGFETVAFCEIEEFPQKVLKKHWPDVPIYEDVRELNHDGPIDVITGGYPCQPFSFAGKRQGAEDGRHLWPAMFSLIKKHKPSWIIAENVAGHIDMGLDEVLADLESAEYEARAFIIPACAINAPHRRDRVWIIANSNEIRREGSAKKEILQIGRMSWEPMRSFEEWNRRSDLPPSRFCRANDGIPRRVDRLEALGNSIVPQIPELIGNAILESEKQNA